MRSRRLLMSQRALDDLLGIYSYIANYNPTAARRLLDELTHKMEWMAKVGITGVGREFIPGLRAFPYRERCIYFLIDDGKMTVLRVLHGHQNISSDDFSDT
jgi:toxin ParE1/3/4